MKIFSYFVIYSLLLTSSIANAGAALTGSLVTINGTSSASGVVAAAHHHWSPNEFIYCKNEAIKSGSFMNYKITCEAKTVNNQSLMCERWFEDSNGVPEAGENHSEDLMNVVTMINKSSKITFQRDSQGKCSGIFVENKSNHLPTSW